MSKRRKYIKRASEFVTAVQIDLDLESFTYRKWGAIQRCSCGDWLVDNQGDVYTVEGATFARTYRQTGPGTYVKTTPVWAEVATAAGEVPTKEGSTHFEGGDYLVYNQPDGRDGYAVAKRDFERIYQAMD
jgi:hypothetical protein